MIGRVETYLKSELKKKKSALLFVLIDSEVSNINSSVKLAKDVEKIGASAILVGGSSATDQIEMAEVVKNLKKAVRIPKILFPGNVTGVVPLAEPTNHADVPSPITRYAVGSGSNPNFRTLGAPSAWA